MCVCVCVCGVWVCVYVRACLCVCVGRGWPMFDDKFVYVNIVCIDVSFFLLPYEMYAHFEKGYLKILLLLLLLLLVLTGLGLGLWDRRYPPVHT